MKLKDVVTDIIKEKDGSFAVSCSALGVYSVGRTLEAAKTNFEEALTLHLSVLKERALKEMKVHA